MEIFVPVASDGRLEIGRWPFWKAVIAYLSEIVAEEQKKSSCAAYNIMVPRSDQKCSDTEPSPLHVTVAVEGGGSQKNEC